MTLRALLQVEALRALLAVRTKISTGLGSGDHVQQILCLRSWQRTGIITLDGALFEQAVRRADGAPISDQLPIPNNTYESDDEVLYHEHE
jgi:hypothetical protein